MTEYWEPRTEQDLEQARDGGLLAETHIFDVKKEPPPAHKNRHIAIDLASFAVDGGRILYGVAQPTSKRPTELVPFNTTQLAERLDQIARGGLIDPPLRIRCVDIPSATDLDRGYLLVVVPRSPDAPHMVDGVYRGRSDRTNTRLSDDEVRRIMAERQQRHRDIATLLEDEVARDPTSPDLRAQGHLFIVAQPLRADRHLLSRALVTQDWRPWIHEDFRCKIQSFQPSSAVSPDVFVPEGGYNVSARMSGWAVHSYYVTEDRSIRPEDGQASKEDDLLDLEIHDDGGLRMFCGRATYDRESHGGHMIFERLIVTLVRRIIRAAAAVSEKADFLGEWGFGVALRGIGTGLINRGPISGNAAIRVEAYDETATVAFEQVDQDPDTVVRLLLTRFFRGLGRLDQIPDLEGIS